MKMRETEVYIKSWGQLTKEQEKKVKNTFGYDAALLADAFNDFGKEIIKSLKFWKKIKLRLIKKHKVL